LDIDKAETDADLADPQGRRHHPQEPAHRAEDPVTKLAHGLRVIGDSEAVLVEGRRQNLDPPCGPPLEQDELQRIGVRRGIVRISPPMRLKGDAFQAVGSPHVLCPDQQ
jgi:hypothetical protein